jgi:hypothetical protein
VWRTDVALLAVRAVEAAAAGGLITARCHASPCPVRSRSVPQQPSAKKGDKILFHEKRELTSGQCGSVFLDHEVTRAWRKKAM